MMASLCRHGSDPYFHFVASVLDFIMDFTAVDLVSFAFLTSSFQSSLMTGDGEL